MENIVILDTETTGLDVAKGHVIEVAAILYNIPTRSILSQVSTLLYAESNDAYEINRIDVAALKLITDEIQNSALNLLMQIMISGDAIIAHNAAFDKKWIESIDLLNVISKNKRWICTKNDVKWPIRKGVPLNLIHICADLGVPIISTHRALQDCILLLDAIECNTDIETFLDRSEKGRMIYNAQVSYEERQIVKDSGFQWDNLKKVWFARLTQEEAATLPFMCYPAEKNCQSS